ncbi:ead/Ea22-like family protein [Dactylosporangium sp. NPDC005572]|uniref:ead/Ea22-like family protein n=1 Tax=Dactylosporangium sp. NPDC005572 TaxID=3156889 RepID=UPI0033A378ED
MPAEELLTRAAAKLREIAEAATPGPWTEDITGSVQGPDRRRVVYSVGIAEGRFPRDSDRALITAMHPPVALALADLLDSYAIRTPFAGWDGINGQHLIALARAVLREEADHG